MARGGIKGDQRPIIIKRVKKVAAGHHGGAWKVAYADFVTAMMAFFMLLWLLTVTDKQTLSGIADYFTPSAATMSNSSGSGSILGGTAMQKDGAMSQGSVALATPTSQQEAKNKESQSESSENAGKNDKWQADPPNNTADPQLVAAQQDIKAAIQNAPTLAEFQDQILMELTPEGLKIELVDKDRRPMFKTGTAELYPYGQSLIRAIGQVVASLPNRVQVTGHTDNQGGGAGNGAYSNWELSSDRANAARRTMRSAQVLDDRFAEVTGKAATDPLYPDTPGRAENRRIGFLVLREAPVVAPAFGR
jgi:chemotaxis protein MotB